MLHYMHSKSYSMILPHVSCLLPFFVVRDRPKTVTLQTVLNFFAWPNLQRRSELSPSYDTGDFNSLHQLFVKLAKHFTRKSKR